MKNSGDIILDKLKRVRNIIFDMDGTLVNTAVITVPACQQAASIFGLPEKDSQEISGLIGYADPEFCYRLYPGYDHNILNEYSNEVAKIENNLAYKMGLGILYNGILEMLESLQYKGCYLTIASTGSNEHVEASLNSSGIKSMFQLIRCNEPEKSGIVKEIINAGPKGDWLIMGDRNSDLNAGVNNGIITIAAKYGFGSLKEYEQFDLGVDYPQQLLSLLEI